MLLLLLWKLAAMHQMPQPKRCVTSCRGDTCFYVEDWECEDSTCEQLPEGSRCKPVMVNLGPWDPAPAPKDWPETINDPSPPAWGQYPTEQLPLPSPPPTEPDWSP